MSNRPGGIPETDLSAEAQAALEKANEALTEIPVASVIQLGGVKPVGKDGDMTQNVGIDAQGRLYTYPPVTYVPILFKSTYDLPDTVGSSVGLMMPFSRRRQRISKPEIWYTIPTAGSEDSQAIMMILGLI